MRCRSTSAHVGWTTNTSVPRMFSSIWNETSVSGNRCSLARPTGTCRKSAISSASALWALPAKTFSCPLAMVAGNAPVVIIGVAWLGREDSNLRIRDPKSRAFPLGPAPENLEIGKSANLAVWLRAAYRPAMPDFQIPPLPDFQIPRLGFRGHRELISVTDLLFTGNPRGNRLRAALVLGARQRAGDEGLGAI